MRALLVAMVPLPSSSPPPPQTPPQDAQAVRGAALQPPRFVKHVCIELAVSRGWLLVVRTEVLNVCILLPVKCSVDVVDGVAEDDGVWNTAGSKRQ